MKLIIQRVKEAKVDINGNQIAKISVGLLVFVGINDSDNDNNIEWLANKLLNLRIFNDENGKMNLSVTDMRGGLLIVPNFTLYADCRKGFRPSFIESAKPEISLPIFNKFLKFLKMNSELLIESGEFGADMQVSLVNDGPVTIEIEK